VVPGTGMALTLGSRAAISPNSSRDRLRAATGLPDFHPSSRSESERRPRPYELLAAGYFALTGLLVLAFGSPLSAWWGILVAHAALVVWLLAVVPRVPDASGLRIVRDWALIVALPVIYKEVDYLNDLFTTGYYDPLLMSAETAIFGAQPSVVLRQLFPWRLLSEYLHFGYFGYYSLLPALAVALYVRRRAAFEYALTVILAVFFFCYLCFIVFPVASPWYTFARPDPEQLGWVFPRLVHRVLTLGAATGAAFPSSHVAAAVVVWLLAWRFSRPLFWAFTAIVPALIVGTVYGGFHYAVDVIAGAMVGVTAYVTGPWVYRAARAVCEVLTVRD
jgi:membrane-associated phospholipid phosphatase